MKLIDIELKSDNRIKPCPFCGITPKIETITLSKNQEVFSLKCSNSFCPTNNNWGIDKQKLINIWNDRM